MKRSDQAALIRRLEAEAEGDPGALRRRVIGLGILGYAFFGGLLLTLLASAAGVVYVLSTRSGAVAIKLLIPIGLAIWACARALFVRFPAVQGVSISPAEAPRLVALLDRLRHALRTPAIHEVLITIEINASVSQRPRLGWFGWYRNTVAIGWPLIEGLSVKELEAVLAHEMGHLSRAHGRLSAWGYRVRATFARLAAQFEAQDSPLNKPVNAFLEWWWPKLDANTFVLSRQQELEADRAAGELAGGQNLVIALLRTASIAESLSRFWPPLLAQAATGQPVPADAMGRLSRFVRAPDTSETRHHLRTVVSASTGFTDTHPALKDRAHALGIPLATEEVLAPIEESAGPHYFREHHESLCARLQAFWQTTVGREWEAYGRFLKSQQVRLEQLSSRPPDDLTAGEAWERCRLLKALGEDAEAFAAAVGLLRRDPENVAALLFVGRERLRQGDERGIEQLTKAARLSGQARGPALMELVDHYRREEEEGKAIEVEKELLAHADELMEASEERLYSETDEVEPHHMSADEVAALVTAMRAAVPDLVEIRVTRKKLRHFGHQEPLYVVGFRVRAPWYRQTGSVSRKALQRLVVVPLGHPAYLVGLDVSPAAASRFAAVPDSIVFSG